MSDDNPTRNAEAKTTAFDGLAVTGIAAEKGIENTGQHLGRNAGAGICNGNFRFVAKTAKCESECAPGLIVFDRVIRQIQEQLA